MNLDNLTLEEAKKILKSQMIRLKKDIKTPTKTYHKNHYYFFIDENVNGVYLYFEDSMTGLQLTNEEADEYLDWAE